MRLHYRKYGSGPPLIILHGLFGSSDNWHSLAKRWGEFFTVYAIDQRNHGSSPHESAMSYPEMANDLSQFLEQQRLEQVYLVGHSMGGKVALLFATIHPENVAGLAILDIGTQKVTGKHQSIIHVLEQVDPHEFSARKDIQLELQNFIDEATIREFLLKNIMRRVDNSFAWKFNHEALLNHYSDLTSALELQDAYTGQVLFLRGSKSNYLEATLSPDILQYFPMAQLTSILDAGHWLHAEAPGLIFSIINEFFSEV